jgi:hypothetical protein
MTDLETRLEQALKADAPAARDPMFRIQVMERRSQAALRRQLLTGLILAFWAAVLAALGLTFTQTLLHGTERLAAVAVIAAAMTALLVAPYLGGRAALGALAARASRVLRTMPLPRLWS